jgi:hypothetical protein
MKCFFLALWLLATGEPSFAQALPDTTAPTTNDLLAKSKRQRAGARTLLIGGGAIAITAIAVAAPGNVGFDQLGALVALGGIGGAAVLGSIPLFAAAARNERKATTATVVLRPLMVPNGVAASSTVPAIGIRVGL